MNEFLKYLLSLIVDYPEKLEITETLISENNYQYTIKSDPLDTGKIIGKQGKIIQAIRNVAIIIAIKKGLKIRIEIA
jgi:uncharacterized protein